jgi:hypothetical protein
MDYEQLACELVRALRGARSQSWLSHRLRLKSNLVYRWEAGRAWPTALRVFQICHTLRMPVAERLPTFLAQPVSFGQLHTGDGLIRFLQHLAEPLNVSDIAARTGHSRFVISRWLCGKTTIRLPDFLRFVDATSLRLLDFLQLLVDPKELPSVARAWHRLQATRAAAYEVPWSHAVLRALELSDYAQSAGRDGWLAARLGLTLAEEAAALKLLADSGQIKRRAGRWHVERQDVVDTSVDPVRRRELRSFWSRVAVDRLELGNPGVHSFNIFTLSEADVPLARALHIDFFNRLRALAAASTPSERVMLYSTQLLALDTEAAS